MKRNLALIEFILNSLENDLGNEISFITGYKFDFEFILNENGEKCIKCDFYNKIISQGDIPNDTKLNEFFDSFCLIYDMQLTDMALEHNSYGAKIWLSRINHKGHEYLSLMRNKDVWNDIIRKAKDAPLDVMIDLGKGYLKKKANDVLGI